MKRLPNLARLEETERALREQAKSASEQEYKQLVAKHLQLIATLKKSLPHENKRAPVS